MDELLKLSIEELEHILAIAPYSEMHQMAYAIKKNQHDTGSMYQVVEGNYHKLVKTQEKLARQVLTSVPTTAIADETEPIDEVKQEVIQDSITSSEIAEDIEVATTAKEFEALDEDSTNTNLAEAIIQDPVTSSDSEEVSQPKVEQPFSEKTPKEKKKKKKKKPDDEDISIESKEMNLVGDVSAFILPDKTKEKKKKNKKKKAKGNKKKSDTISRNVEAEPLEDDTAADPEELTGLSDFSAWLLSQSKESHVHPLKESSRKKDKKKKKKKNKKDKKKKKKNKILVSEPLADLLASQGHIEEAVGMYEKLSLIFPEKNAFFAAKIDKIKKDK